VSAIALRKTFANSASVFNLRPKNSVLLVAILTGMFTSASTLGVVFLADEGLRKTIFEQEKVLKDLQQKQEQIETLHQPREKQS
jgi:uncharacterized protein (DUF3084 family)